MTTLKIYANGSYLVTAGVGDEGFVMTTVGLISRRPGHLPESAPLFQPRGMKGKVSMQVILSWPMAAIAVGDEVTIKVVDRDEVSPSQIRKRNPDSRAKLMEYLRKAKEGHPGSVPHSGSGGSGATGSQG